jgi:hypothetical protein
MAKSESAVQLLQKLQEAENTRQFFDLFKRVEQKARLHGRFPEMTNLIRLQIYKDALTEMFGEDNKYIQTSVKIIDTEIKKALEYSISIDGAGRAEFIKSTFRPKEDDEDEDEDKTIVEQLADKLG